MRLIARWQQLLVLQNRRRSEKERENTVELLAPPANDDASSASAIWVRFVKAGVVRALGRVLINRQGVF